MKLIAKYVPGKTEDARERKAAVLLTGMAGTLTVARVLTNESEGRRMLDAARKFYLSAAQ